MLRLFESVAYRDFDLRFAGFMLWANLMAGAIVSGAENPNVLLIVADDLRPQLNCYGKDNMITPNLDRLASEGILFEHAYCQQAICGPSRASFLTGQRPQRLGVSENLVHFRKTSPQAITMPQHFKRNGYSAISVGKVFHDRDSRSWSEPEWVPEAAVAYPIYTKREILQAQDNYKRDGIGSPRDETWWGRGWWTPVDIVERVPNEREDLLFDYQVASRAIEKLGELENGGKPFFLAVGFFLPHIPYIAPQKYWDLYPEDTIEIPDRIREPEGAPEVALVNSPTIWKYRDIPDDRVLTADTVRRLTRGYYASVSFMDTQVGRVLDELSELGLADDTVVAFIGDHGYHHGEQGTWSKHTNFEVAIRTPLIIRTSEVENAGSKTQSIAELVDLFPSLCELAGLPVPDGLDGRSLVPILKNPSTSVREFAASQYSRDNVMGRTVRTERYRYTEWINILDERTVGVELYDHEVCEDEVENVAYESQYQSDLERLRSLVEGLEN